MEYGPRGKKTCLWGFADNKGAEQPAQMHSLISAFVICLSEVTSSAMNEFILSSGSGFLTDINKTGARTVLTNAYEARNWQLFSKNKE